MDRDAEALLSVGTGVDYTKVEPINHRELLAFVNHFVTHTVHFLNKFSCVCEEKLYEVSTRIQQLEVTMSLLEGKLGSVSGLESVTASEYRPPESVAKAGGEVASSSSAPSASPPSAAASAVRDIEATPAVDTAEVLVAAPVVTKTVSQDPRYKKYFDLNRKGVPIAALRPKMLSEGLNPDLLETPDAPAPEGDQDEDDIFSGQSSDSEDEEEEDSDFDD
ncbi:WASH complex subunit 3-like [Corticium candelabrum]|uniref:WASH complex subunit 3-like n=1 Tax=Corticium candelabrum TaxID=121492 RepID=UPI002E258776|nr:WASH complex subunit 3-like [Corticium candelabrum]